MNSERWQQIQMRTQFSILSFLLFLTVTFKGYGSVQTTSPAVSVNLSDPNVIATGRTIFAQSCSVGYCHGKEGRSGRGPKLRAREWDKDYLFNVILDGIPSSSMPAWKDKLSEQQIWSVVAYILTLSKLTSDSNEAAPSIVSVPTPKSSPAASSLKSAVPSVSSPKSDSVRESRELKSAIGDPKVGKSLFFDSSNDWNCGSCHKVGGLGNEVGPSLDKARHKPARELLKDIVVPGVTVEPPWQLLKVTTKAGEQIGGLKVEEDTSQLKIYDTGSPPPVLRTLAKDQIETIQVENRSAMPEKYGELYTLKQLLDLIAFLKSGDSAPVSSISLSDLF